MATGGSLGGLALGACGAVTMLGGGGSGMVLSAIGRFAGLGSAGHIESK